MATAYLRQTGDWIDYTPPTNPVNAGDVVVQNGLVGIASNDIAVGIQGALRIANAAYDVPLKSGDNPQVGNAMYWDAALLAATTNDAYASSAMGVCILTSPEGNSAMVRVLLLPALRLADVYA